MFWHNFKYAGKMLIKGKDTLFWTILFPIALFTFMYMAFGNIMEKDEMFNTKGKMLQNIMVDLGGRIAEEIIFKDVTTGASQDIKQASKLARAMVTQYGMSDRVGMIQYGSDEDEVFIGRDLAHTKSYGNEIADVIDEEVKRIVDECYTKAKNIILEHEDVLHSCAALLIEKEKIGQEEFEALFKNHEPVMHNDGEM